MKIKRLSMLLALVMILSAFAGTFTITSAETELTVNGTKSTATTLAAAITEALGKFTDATGETVTIRLKGDITCSDAAGATHANFAVPAGETLVIEGVKDPDNGNKYPTITAGECRYIQTKAGGTLVLKNLTINGTGERGVIQVGAGTSTVILDNTRITNDKVNAIVVQGNCTLNVTNGSVVTQSAAVESTATTKPAAILVNEDGAKCYVTTGSTVQATGAYGNAIYVGAADTTVSIVNSTVSHANNAGALISSSGANATIIVQESTLSHSASSSGSVITTSGDGTQVTVKDTTITQAGNYSPISLSGKNGKVVLEGFLRAKTSGACHAIVLFSGTGATGNTLEISNAYVVDSGSAQYTRVLSGQAANSMALVKDSIIWSKSTDSVFEFNTAGTDAAPNSVTIDHSAIIHNGDGKGIVHTESTCTYTNVTIQNGSFLNSSADEGLVIQGDSTVKVTDSTIVSSSIPVTAVAGTDVIVTNSGLRTTTAGTAIVTNATPTYTNSATVVGTTLTKQNVTTATDDELYGRAGLPFRVGSDYYDTLANAIAAGNQIYVVGDHYTKTNSGSFAAGSTLTGVPDAKGEYPNLYSSHRFSANVGTTVEWKNLNMFHLFGGQANQQVNNGGVLTLDNVTMTSMNGNGCLVAQHGSKIIVKNSTLTAYDSGALRPNEGVASIEVINSDLIGIDKGYPVYVMNNWYTTGSVNNNNWTPVAAPNFTLTIDEESLLDASKGKEGIYVVAAATDSTNYDYPTVELTLTIKNSDVSINVTDASGIILHPTGGQTLNILDSTVKTYDDGATAQTTLAVVHVWKTDSSNPTNPTNLNVSHSVLDGSGATKHRAVYWNDFNASTTVTLTNSVFTASTASGTCPAVKAAYDATTFIGENVINGTYDISGKNWLFENVAIENGVNANIYGASGTAIGIDMLDGAAVRCVEDSSGIRFISKMSGVAPGWTTNLANGDDPSTYTRGTIIFKNSDLTAYLAANSGKTVYDFIAAAKGGAYKIADITATSNGTHIDNGDTYLFAALVNIQDYTMDFGAVSYVEFAGQCIYSAFDTTNNVRNIREVATAAYNDYKQEANTVKDGYVYYNYVENKGYSCYSNAQREILASFLAA